MDTRPIRRLLLSVVLAILTLSTSHAAALGPPPTRAISWAYFGQDIVVLDTSEGLYRSNNQGWEQIRSDRNPDGTGSANYSISEEGAIYAYTYDYKQDDVALEVSLDGGVTWTSSGSLPAEAPLSSLKISASPVSSTVFLTHWVSSPLDHSSEVGIWRSMDFGATWEHLFRSNALPLYFSPDFAVDGLVFSESAGYDYMGPVLRSTDWGETWEISLDNVRLGYGPSEIVMSPSIARDDTVFVMYDDILYRSQDRGETWWVWSRLPEAQRDLAISPRYDSDYTLLAGRYISQDRGQSWETVTTGAAIHDVGIRLNRPFGNWPPAPTEDHPAGPYLNYLPVVALDRGPSLDLWVVEWVSIRDDMVVRHRPGLDAEWEDAFVFP